MTNDLFSTLRSEFWMTIPQIQLVIFGLAILLTDFLLKREHKALNAVFALTGLAVSGFTLWRLWLRVGGEAVGFAGSLRFDSFFVFFSTLFLAAAALVVLLSVRYMDIEDEHSGDYYALMLFAVVGMMFMAAGTDLIVLYIALETMALSFYVLAGFLRADKRSNEGALKYLLLGAFSSGLLAYGFSILYGISGSTNLQDIQAAVAARPADDLLTLLAFVTCCAGLFFKVAAVPFHQWAPDVYEGAPTSITAFLSVASKAASFALLLRIFLIPFGGEEFRSNWDNLVGVVAVVTMTVGNFAALTQTNVKRLLAYSSIAHAGYILLGIVAGNEIGLRGVGYYLLAYTFMNTGAFAVVILMRRKGLIGENIEDLNGLIHRSPGAAVLMLVFLLSLAGIPPTAGFVGKLLIFWGLIEARHYVLAIFGALYIVPAVYYYMRIVKHMWMTEATDPVRPTMTFAQGAALAVAVFITLAAGIYPEPFLRLASYSVFLTFPR